MTDKEKVYIAIDTEFESENIITGNCLQLAFVVFVTNINYVNVKMGREPWIKHIFSVCFKDQGKEKNLQTMDFWRQFPKIYSRIQHEAIEMSEAFLKIQIWLNHIYRKYEVVNYVADHSSVDFPWFKNLYLTHCDTRNDNFTLPWKCLCTYNMIQTFLLVQDIYSKEDIQKLTTNINYPHTHYAIDDAIQTAYEYLTLLDLFKKLNKKLLNLLNEF